MLVILIFLFFSATGAMVGYVLYGESTIKQLQSGIFFGLSLGCFVIMLIQILQLIKG